MAISGFGNTPGNLRLGKPLTLGQNKQQVEGLEEEAKKEESLKAEVAPPKLSPEQVKFDQVDSLLIGRGIIINKPEQPQEPEQPKIKPNAVFIGDDWSIPDGLKTGDVVLYLGDDGQVLATYRYTSNATLQRVNSDSVKLSDFEADRGDIRRQ